MNPDRAVEEYRKSAVSGASPIELIIALYDAALRFMEAGKSAIAAGDAAKQDTFLQKAQRVLNELMSCLDLTHGGEIAKNLLALYTYMLNELVAANVHDDARRVEVCMKIMRELRETWVELARAVKEAPAQQKPLAA